MGVEEDNVKLLEVADLRVRSSEFQVDIAGAGRVMGKIGVTDEAGFFTILGAGEPVTAPRQRATRSNARPLAVTLDRVDVIHTISGTLERLTW